MWNSIKKDLLILSLYGLFGVVLGINGVGVLENPLGFFSSLIILLAVDILSFNSGLRG